MGAAEKLENINIMQITPGRWVLAPVIVTMFGFTKDQLKKYRAGAWLYGKHYTRNPANTMVYNPDAISDWMEGKL